MTVFWLLVIFSNYHNNDDEVKNCSADVHAVQYRTCQGEKQEKINKLVILSRAKIKQALQVHT